MPVHVSVPLRLRADPRALFRLDELESAAQAAVRRALLRSREVVVDARGGYLDVALSPPTFSWCGPGIAAVPGDQRARVEALLSAVWTRAAEEAELFSRARAAAPEVLPSEVRERFD